MLRIGSFSKHMFLKQKLLKNKTCHVIHFFLVPCLGMDIGEGAGEVEPSNQTLDWLEEGAEVRWNMACGKVEKQTMCGKHGEANFHRDEQQQLSQEKLLVAGTCGFATEKSVHIQC